MARDYTPLPFRFYDELDGLNDEEYGRLVRAMQAYSIDGTEPELPGTERLFWKMCKNAMDYYSESYDKKCSANSENAKKGGRPKKSEQNISQNGKTQENRTVPNKTQENRTVFTKTQKTQVEDKEEGKVKDKDNNPLKPPKGAKRSDAEFEIFWSAYPTKVGKQPARKAFDKAKVPVETLVAAIDRQKCSSQWSKDGGRYIPNPATWLNQCRWEDELPEDDKPKWGDGKRSLDADEQAAIRRMFGGETNGQTL